MKRIAQIGTFDLENYGDLLFPLVLKEELRRRVPDLAIDLFSPKGGAMPFDGRPVYPIGSLPERFSSVHYDAVVIGGGDLIRCDAQFAPSSEYKHCSSPQELWQLAVNAARQAGAKIIFNAPGVPFPLAGAHGQQAAACLADVEYLSVRGWRSAAALRDCGVRELIHVVPDSAFLMQGVYSDEQLEAAYRALCRRCSLPEDYLLVQYNDYAGTSDLAAAEAVLRQLEQKLGCRIVLMPIGYVHRDEVFLAELNAHNSFAQLTGRLTICEMMTLLAHARYTAASSFHGIITSMVFQVPCFPLHIARTNKMQELCEMAGVEDSLCLCFEDLLSKAPATVSPSRLAALIAEANRHMDEIARLLGASSSPSEQLHKTEIRLCQTEIQRETYREQLLFTTRERDNLRSQVEALAPALQATQAQLAAVLDSTIWRSTRPLRRLIELLRHQPAPAVQPAGAPAGTSAAAVQPAAAESSAVSERPGAPVYEPNEDFSQYATDIKPLALYLPQFHTIPENDAWWGKGFTEWTNVKKGTPRFEGHNQPRVPEDELGYYDLTDVEVLKKQVALAKQHGIYGFAYYYYWFSGKRLLEKPMDLLLAHPEIDFPFCAVWANENWTRTWDGMQDNILIAQEYSPKDAERFILDLQKYVEDRRYLRVRGKPVIGVYEPRLIPDLPRFLSIWRETARRCGIGEILIWSCVSGSYAEDLGIEELVDGQYEFPPRGKDYVHAEEVPGEGSCFDYGELVESERHFDHSRLKVPTYRCSMLEWDNSARKQTHYHCWKGYTPERFYLWNCINAAYTRRHFAPDERFIFINAWNEWGEGTYLEPDKPYGYAALNALSRAIMDLPYACQTPAAPAWALPSAGESILFLGGGVPTRCQGWDRRLYSGSPRIAVQAHVFYPELIEDVCRLVNNIPYPFDLYVSTTEQYKATYIGDYLQKHCGAVHVYVAALENKGRDVLPFLTQLRPVLADYDYFCHIHTKKSLHDSLGELWRDYLYENLLGSKEIVQQTLCLFEQDPALGVIFPETLEDLKPSIEWGCNRQLAEWLLRKMGIPAGIVPDDILFPAGDMFWARTSAVQDLFQVDYTEADFPEESGQVDGTLMHAIERLWLYVAQYNGYTYQVTRSVLDNCPLPMLHG